MSPITLYGLHRKIYENKRPDDLIRDLNLGVCKSGGIFVIFLFYFSGKCKQYYVILKHEEGIFEWHPGIIY